MANIGRIALSLLSGAQETQLALASANFDFSVIKVEAPAAFHGVGSALSRRRQLVAEAGQIHTTARKLGALFEGLVPFTPRLFDAYGHRASEIASQSQDKTSRGIFSDFVGPDATSIWAAATSGQSAIAVHLLACLLARLWKPAEALAIWEELVNGRRAQLLDETASRTFQASAYFASQVAISKEQLAEWDHSARSWLRLADKVKDIQQTKVKFVVDDLKLPVSSKAVAFDSAVEVWTMALQGMEQLLIGRPQGVSAAHANATTSVMLALSSWHLYPDISVSGAAPILQADPLFPHGCVVTLNLQGNPSRDTSGIYWSLSLSRLRYYGDPIRTERIYSTASARIYFSQLLQIVLGCISMQWGHDGIQMYKVAQVIAKLGEVAENRHTRLPEWLQMLRHASEDFITSHGVYMDLNKKLFRLGREKARFLLGEAWPLPIFDLSDFEIFVAALKTPQSRLKILRKYACRWFPTANHSRVIIRYRISRAELNLTKSTETKEDEQVAHFASKGEEEAAITDLHHKSCEFSKADQVEHGTNKSSTTMSLLEEIDPMYGSIGFRNLVKQIRDIDTAGNEKHVGKHDTLVDDDMSDSSPRATKRSRRESGSSTRSRPPFDRPLAPKLAFDLALSGAPTDAPTGTIGKESDLIILTTALPQMEDREQPYIAWTNTEEKFTFKETLKDIHLGTEWLYDPDHQETLRAEKWNVSVDKFTTKASKTTSLMNDDTEMDEDSGSEPKLIYSKFIGDALEGSIFVEKSVLEEHEERWKAPVWAKLPKIKRTIDIEDVLVALQDDALDLSVWHARLNQKKPAKIDNQCYQSLLALTQAWHLYKELAGATISPEGIKTPIVDRHWAQSVLNQQKQKRSKRMSRGEAFACITNLETGEIDLSPDRFSGVMAISTDDSIYVSARLLSDPADRHSADLIKRLSGNVGRPGLTIMIPPVETMVTQPKVDSWQVIERGEFTGQRDDDFSQTTLHLAFTDWSQPIDMGDANRGQRTSEAHIVETLVSVHDAGRWIAEIDVLSALSKGYGQADHQYFYRSECHHEMERDASPDDIGQEIITIRSWDEFLDRPSCPAVAMAHGNWEAKLAMASLAIRRGDRVFVNNVVCSVCLQDLIGVGGEEMGRKALILV